MRTRFAVVIWLVIGLLLGWGLLMASPALWFPPRALASLVLRETPGGLLILALSGALPLWLAGVLAVWASKG